MRSLSTGSSPVISARVPDDLHAAVMALAGNRRGDVARWLREVLEREVARSAMQSTPGHDIVTLDKQHRKVTRP